MGANIKISSDAKQFQQEMQKVTQDLKLMSSELGVVTTKAELFGSEQDKLDAKSKTLTNSIKGQNTILGLQKQTISALTGDVQKYKDRNTELSKSIAEVEAKLKESIKSTGEDSKETKQLQQELSKLQKEYQANGKAIDKSNKQIDTYKIKMNDTEKVILKATKELQDLDKTVEKSPSKWEKLNKSVKDTEEKLSGVNKVAGFTAGVIGTAFGGAVIAGVKNSNDLTMALNNLKAKTSVTNEQMGEYKGIMEDIYTSNFGEGYDDIAEAMAKVNQVTWQTGEELKNTTKNALLVRDTFGYDVNESINTANGLMKNFGITSEQAYTLIAQGAQAGADKNGDLLDSLNEYGVQFAKLGLSAEDFTNILIDGASQGAFSVDKVGDSVKEFAIRAVDGSKTTQEGFQLMGLDANNMAKEISKGGDSAKQAFNKTLTALVSIKDPLKQQQAGVALFGTQFEDLGIKGIKALADIGDNANRNGTTLKEINNIKYDNLNSAITGIGRQLQTGLSDVITTDVLPKVNEFANNIQTNMPKIKQDIKTAIDITIPIISGMGKAIGFVIDNSNILIPVVAGLTASIGTLKIISGITNLIDLWKKSTFAETLAQEGLNVALRNNPIGIVITVIGLLVTAFVYAWQNSEKFRNTIIWAFNGIKEACKIAVDWISNNLKWLGNNIENIFDGLVFIFEHPFEALKIGANKVLDWLESKFKNLNLNLPRFKLPHFSLEGEFSLSKLTVPHVSVDWYSSGAIFTQPTLLGGIGVGDANKGFGSNAEAVLPLNVLWDELGKNFDKLEQKLSSKQQQQVFVIHTHVDMEGREIARGTATYMSEELAYIDKNNNFGLGGV